MGDVGGADFHFQSGGHAVEGFDALAGGILAVLVQVDETGSNDEAGGMNDAASVERRSGDGGNLAVANADVADGVEASLGINDAPAFDHEVVLLGGGNGCCEGESECEEEIAHGGSEGSDHSRRGL